MPATPDLSDRISALLREHPVLDGHNDLPWAARELVDYDWDRLDIGAGGPATHTDLPRLAAGGVGGQFWSVYVPSNLPGGEALTQTLEQIDAVRQMVRRWPERLELVTTAAGAMAASSSGKIASLLGAEGGHSMNCSMSALRLLYALGVRYMTLTHNDNTPWADSATDVEVLGGLSAFGREVVAEMQRLGMLVDLSHVSPGTMRSALDAAQAPVIFSHSSARAVCDAVRNVPDDVLERLPGNGGVCMVTFVPGFVSPAVLEWTLTAKEAAAASGVNPNDYPNWNAFSKQYRLAHPAPHSSIEDVVAHVEHVREVAGVDHIGLGGDYDGVDALPEGLEDVSGYPRLLAALADRGWSDADLAGLTSGNILRVLGEAERRAGEIATTRAPSLARIEKLDGTPGT